MMGTAVLAAKDSSADTLRPADADGASINDTPMSDPEDPELSDEDIDLFEDDPSISTE